MPDMTSSLFPPSITLKTHRKQGAAKQQLPLTDGETAVLSGRSDWMRLSSTFLLLAEERHTSGACLCAVILRG